MWFDRAWDFAARSHYDTTTVNAMLTGEQRERLRHRAAALGSREQLAAELNQFFTAAGFSHTGVYTPRDLEYWVLNRIGSHELATPGTWHIGAMFAPGPNGWVVRTVLEGYPASMAGMRRGDIVLGTTEGGFHPFGSFADGRARHLRLQRRSKRLTVFVPPVFEGPLESFRQATLLSIRRERIGEHRIGVVHLWCCTNTEMREALREAVQDSLADCEGIVLDLRDGFGGGFNEYLDLFYPDRRQRILISEQQRGGLTPSDRPEVGPYHRWFDGPLVVVVNEGTRSAKELIAFQLQRTGRATLVGERTAGALCTAAFAHADGEQRIIVEVPGSELFLSGEKIEGVGVLPDRRVPWPLESAHAGDPQMRAALEVMKVKLARSASPSAQ